MKSSASPAFSARTSALASDFIIIATCVGFPELHNSPNKFITVISQNILDMQAQALLTQKKLISRQKRHTQKATGTAHPQQKCHVQHHTPGGELWTGFPCHRQSAALRWSQLCMHDRVTIDSLLAHLPAVPSANEQISISHSDHCKENINYTTCLLLLNIMTGND